MAFTEKHFISTNSRGQHRIVYSDWGPVEATPIICVPGLTGNGRDFDILAEALVRDGRRLICVDLAGRGRSDFLPNPLDYNYDQYTKDLKTLLTHIGIDGPDSVDWLGVSLGGLLGIKIAGERKTPIRRLILNDVGPEVPKAALDFIHSVISQHYRFSNIGELEKRMRETRGLTWGPVTDHQWKLMAEHNARALPDGSITYGYDPNIAQIFEKEPTGDKDLWPSWDRVQCPVMLIHGYKSVVLNKNIVAQMKTLGPGPEMHYVMFKDCGHVPSLMAPNQIQVIREWLQMTANVMAEDRHQSLQA
jgi:pimeloyl-ACP methyl ester carboxylesterase